MQNDFLQYAAASGATGLLISWTLQSMKKSTVFSWLSVESGRINFLTSAIMSFFAAMAISYSFQMSSVFDGGNFRLTIDGSLAGIVHGILRWGWQMLNTQGMYKLFIVPAEAQGEIRCLLKQLIDTNTRLVVQGARTEVYRATYTDSPRP